MRQIGNGLNESLVLLRAHFVEHQRQDDGTREAEHQAQRRERQGIAKDAGEFAVGQKPDEVLEAVVARPGASPNAELKGIILKRDLDARQGDILEYDVVNRHRQKKYIEDPVALHELPGLRPGPVACLLGLRSGKHSEITRLPFVSDVLRRNGYLSSIHSIPIMRSHDRQALVKLMKAL